MVFRVKQKLSADPADWVLIVISWIVFLGGIFFLSRQINSWVFLALGALPVLITAWYLGTTAGLISAFFTVSLDLGLIILQGNYSISLDLISFNHLIGFSLLAISGLLTGHLRDLQSRSRKELNRLAENNQKLTQLSSALEAINTLTTDLISSQDWEKKIPALLKSIGSALNTDHLVLVQLTGEGEENYLLKTHHYWKEDTSLVEGDLHQAISDDLQTWIKCAKPGSAESGKLEELTEDLRHCLSFGRTGSFILLPIFANTALWGCLGLENNQDKYSWSGPEINTFSNIAQTLGSIIYKKLIEDHLNLRAKELDSLQKASLNISSGDQLETNLYTILSQILNLVPASDTTVYLLNNQKMEYHISLGENQQQSLPFSHPGEKDLLHHIRDAKRDEFISNLRICPFIPQDLVVRDAAAISLALKAASELIGVLNIWFDDVREFNDGERTILRLLADQAASAIINVQYLQAEREQRILAEALRKANIQLSDNLDLKQVLESILQQVLILVSARDSNIYLYDGTKLEFGAVMYADDVQQDPVLPPDEDSLLYKTARSGEWILVPNIQDESSLSGTWKTGSMISLPLIFHRSVIGIMNISFYEPGDFDEQVLQVLHLLGNQAAVAINNASTYEAEREQRRLAQALQQTGRAIQSSLDLEVVLDQILTQISTVIHYHSANLILIENGNAIVVRQQGYNNDQKKLLAGQESVAPFDVTRFNTLEKMTESKQPIIIPNTEADPNWVKTATTEKVLSWAGSPILDDNGVIGFLSLNNHTRNFYKPEHAEILSAFASQAAIALVHARLHQEIQEMAITDQLTGIFNRRGLDRWGQYEIERAKRFSSPLTAIFFDLDHFKEINDNYGHDVGDIVLQHVVDCSQRVIRSIDIFSRIGGEEFLIILPETSLPTAVQVSERLREIIAESDIPINSGKVQITISLGVVELSETISDLPDLINAADTLMYQSKQAGRNRSSFPSA